MNLWVNNKVEVTVEWGQMFTAKANYINNFCVNIANKLLGGPTD